MTRSPEEGDPGLPGLRSLPDSHPNEQKCGKWAVLLAYTVGLLQGTLRIHVPKLSHLARIFFTLLPPSHAFL
jgi:hypothetical protein